MLKKWNPRPAETSVSMITLKMLEDAVQDAVARRDNFSFSLF